MKRSHPAGTLLLAFAILLLLGAAGQVTAQRAADLEISGPMLNTAFPHDLHAEEADCATCHIGVARPEREVALVSPETCSDCHDDSDVQPFFPVDSYHGGDYLHRHALESTLGGARCATCHEDSESCAMCHHGEDLDQAGHPRNWRFMHAIESRHMSSDCTACHSLETFCTDCHMEERVEPGSHRLGGWGRGVVHGSEARRDPMFCASCHAGREPVCVDCHNTP